MTLATLFRNPLLVHHLKWSRFSFFPQLAMLESQVQCIPFNGLTLGNGNIIMFYKSYPYLYSPSFAHPFHTFKGFKKSILSYVRTLLRISSKVQCIIAGHLQPNKVQPCCIGTWKWADLVFFHLPYSWHKHASHHAGARQKRCAPNVEALTKLPPLVLSAPAPFWSVIRPCNVFVSSVPIV